MVATPNDYVAPPMLYDGNTIILSLNTSEPVPRSVQLGTNIFFAESDKYHAFYNTQLR